MSFKLETQIQNFRYDLEPQKSIFVVEWFHFDAGGSNGPEMRGFNKEELDAFTSYVVGNTYNFGGPKNYFEVTQSDIQDFEQDLSQSMADKGSPEYIVLTWLPIVTNRREIHQIMDILLISRTGRPDHDYDLNFAAIGKILQKLS